MQKHSDQSSVLHFTSTIAFNVLALYFGIPCLNMSDVDPRSAYFAHPSNLLFGLTVSTTASSLKGCNFD